MNAITNCLVGGSLLGAASSERHFLFGKYFLSQLFKFIESLKTIMTLNL